MKCIVTQNIREGIDTPEDPFHCFPVGSLVEVDVDQLPKYHAVSCYRIDESFWEKILSFGAKLRQVILVEHLKQKKGV